ncbi:MAG: GNAT family N-acetyltransferase [Aggregatilineales bacterium]
MSDVTVRKVETKADFTAFFEFPWTLYKDDPNWIPPLLSIRRETLDKEKNPAWDYMDGAYFVAWRGNKPVGTITAHINHRHNDFANENVGWFGFFEAYDDPMIANALLETAAAWVKAQDCTTIRGPQNFTTHEECGLLVDNFAPPVILMPYNPPYYQGLIEGAGFTKAMDVVSMYYDFALADENKMDARVARIVKRAKKRSGITVRRINARQKKAEFARFKDIYNKAWASNWGFVPMTDKELDTLIEGLGIFFDSRLAYFAEINGELAGFLLGVPDLNEVLHKAYPKPGDPELWTMAKAGWHWKVRRIIRRFRIPLMGVLPEHRNRGVEIAMMYELFQTVQASPFTQMDAGWILETNQLINIVEKFGSDAYKTYRFYEKHLE